MAQKSQKTIKNGPKQSQKRQKWAPRPSRPQPQEPPAPVLMTKTFQKVSKKFPETLFGKFFDLFGSRRKVFGEFFKNFWRVFGRLRKSCQKGFFECFCRNLDKPDLAGMGHYGSNALYKSRRNRLTRVLCLAPL